MIVHGGCSRGLLSGPPVRWAFLLPQPTPRTTANFASKWTKASIIGDCAELMQVYAQTKKPQVCCQAV